LTATRGTNDGWDSEATRFKNPGRCDNLDYDNGAKSIL
jgi:hypothetical protein